MNEITERTAEFQQKVFQWGIRATSSEADKTIAAEMVQARQQHERNGFLMTSQDTLAKYEADQRRAYDRQLSSDGTVLEIERNVLKAEIEEAIAKAQPLQSQAQQHGTSGEKYLLGHILDELQLSRVRSELRGLTRTQVLEQYTASKDDTDNAFVRTIEAAVLANDLPRLGIVEDDNTETDVLVIPRLRDAVNARRRARVPVHLFKAQADIDTSFSLNTGMILKYLRQGVGVASRPTVVQ